MKVRIRKAKPEDWKIIQKLNYEVDKEIWKYDAHFNINHPYDTNQYYKDVVSKNEFFTLIAEVNGKPIAYFIGKENNLSYRTNKVGEIDNIGTLEKYRSLGIGTQLVNRFKAWCIKKGLTHIAAYTYVESKRAIAFYERMGMKSIYVT